MIWDFVVVIEDDNPIDQVVNAVQYLKNNNVRYNTLWLNLFRGVDPSTNVDFFEQMTGQLVYESILNIFAVINSQYWLFQ